MLPFKLICSKHIPTSHTSHITVDKTTLLYAMIKKMKLGAGQLIYNQIFEVVKPYQGPLFLALITKLCINVRVKIGEGEEGVKPGMTNSVKPGLG